GSASVTASLAELTPGTTYHYRVRVRTAAGVVAYGQDSTLTTAASSPAPPTISAGPETRSAASRALFSWAGAELGGHYECRLDQDSFRTCTSPHEAVWLRARWSSPAATVPVVVGAREPPPSRSSHAAGGAFAWPG
ncbi:MAG: hypothetical protein M3P39_08150, partial [Actinomycetota bacterium]|nr:hypothetical protein [Actinomycetota bacterium]